MKKPAILLVAAFCLLAFAPGAPALEQGKPFLWDGTHWAQVSTEGKVGYIFGIGNLADFEVGAAGKRQLPCISRAFVDDLKSKTVMQIVQEVDKYYQENAGKPEIMKTPVIEVVLRRCTTVCPPETPKGAPKK